MVNRTPATNFAVCRVTKLHRPCSVCIYVLIFRFVVKYRMALHRAPPEKCSAKNVYCVAIYTAFFLYSGNYYFWAASSCFVSL